MLKVTCSVELEVPAGGLNMGMAAVIVKAAVDIKLLVYPVDTPSVSTVPLEPMVNGPLYCAEDVVGTVPLVV